MSVGTGIFFGAVFMGLIYLYVNTKDIWAWRKITKRVMLTILVVIVILGIVVGAVIAYDSYQVEKAIQEKERPGLVNSLEGVSIGQKLSDVRFKVAIKRAPDSDDEKDLAYVHAEKDNVLIYFDKSTNLVSSVGVRCTDDAFKYPSLYSVNIHGIQCGSSSENIISTYPEGMVRALCFSASNDETGIFASLRTYDVPAYGVQYVLETNKVSRFIIQEPKRLSEEQDKFWKPCE